MELTWPLKLRIGAAGAVGIVLLYVVAWPLIGNSLQTGTVSYGRAVLLIGLAFVSGLIGYFVSWPYGREIGIMAAPAGVAVCAFRSGTMASLFQQNPSISQRQELTASLQFEPVIWLVVVASGLAGVLLGQKVYPSRKSEDEDKDKKSTSNPVTYLNPIIAVALSAFIAHLLIGKIAQNVTMPDNILGSVTAQPARGQIAFAVLVSFGAAAFVVRKFLNAGYIWPSIATVLVTAFSMHSYTKELSYMAQNWPAVFVENAVSLVLPIQMVAFGTLGSIAGYWMSFRYDYWRKHEMK